MRSDIAVSSVCLAKSSSTGQVLLLVALLAGLALLGGLGVMFVRRKLLAQDQSASDEGMFESLRRLRDSGKISIQEYDAAKRSLVEKSKAAMDAKRPSPKQ